MAIREHTVQVPGGQPVKIFAETDNINYFINGNLTPDAEEETEVRSAAVPQYSRRRYPGDLTPISVASSQKEYLYDPEMQVGSALPGKTFAIKAYGPDGSPTEFRQFTYQGRFVDLHAFLRSEATYECVLYNNTGAKHPIAATNAP